MLDIRFVEVVGFLKLIVVVFIVGTSTGRSLRMLRTDATATMAVLRDLILMLTHEKAAMEMALRHIGQVYQPRLQRGS
jgi:hypothetical protein